MKEARYFYVPNAKTQTELPTEEALHISYGWGRMFLSCRGGTDFS